MPAQSVNYYFSEFQMRRTSTDSRKANSAVWQLAPAKCAFVLKLARFWFKIVLLIGFVTFFIKRVIPCRDWRVIVCSCHFPSVF